MIDWNNFYIIENALHKKYYVRINSYFSQLHRSDGPAWCSKIRNFKYWYFHGKFIGSSIDGFTQEKFERWLKLKAFR